MPRRRPAAVEVRIVNDLDPRQQRQNSGIGKAIFSVLVDKGIAIDQSHGCGVGAIHLC